jgi:hypothetical protein
MNGVNERRARERMGNGEKRRRLSPRLASRSRGNVTPASYRLACARLHTRKAATIKTHLRGVPELAFLSGIPRASAECEGGLKAPAAVRRRRNLFKGCREAVSLEADLERRIDDRSSR